jgi:serine/threonine protein kinase
MLPTTINGYTLKHLLGEGGMANVYFAENRIGKCAAIKMLKPEFLAQAAIKQRFWQDAEIMAGLKHPNIREVYDFVETDTYMAIIMEYLEGDDLSQYLKQHGAVSETVVNTWLAALLEAFQYAHDKGIVHRDVKPSNVFLTTQGEVKIIDFGIAKMNDGNHEWTLTNMKMGTPAYMSPEQILTPRNVDSRADVYSLGVLYYTLLAGKKPYNEDTTSDYLIQESVVKHSLPILGMSSDRANTLIAKATQKQVGNRYQTCREMLRALGSTVNVKPPFQSTQIDEITIIDMPETANAYAYTIQSAPPPIMTAPVIMPKPQNNPQTASLASTDAPSLIFTIGRILGKVLVVLLVLKIAYYIAGAEMIIILLVIGAVYAMRKMIKNILLFVVAIALLGLLIVTFLGGFGFCLKGPTEAEVAQAAADSAAAAAAAEVTPSPRKKKHRRRTEAEEAQNAADAAARSVR